MSTAAPLLISADAGPLPGNLSQAVERLMAGYFAAHGGTSPPPGLYSRILREVEKPLIEQTLAVTGGNQLKAAKLLGLNRNTLRKKIRALSIGAGK